jgi:hypothetical protein
MADASHPGDVTHRYPFAILLVLHFPTN